MFWSHVLMLCVSQPILDFDALLISWLTGTERVDNVLRFADGQGYLWIAPACSSLSNISLTILCWVLFAQIRGLIWSWRSVSWCLIACSAVIVINVIRVALMVMHREYFDLVHGPTGASLTNWLTVSVVLGVCLYGTRRGRVGPA
jgi:exosortase/archaeosortase family protein